jgi:hypothetical protein
MGASPQTPGLTMFKEESFRTTYFYISILGRRNSQGDTPLDPPSIRLTSRAINSRIAKD